MSVGRYRRLVLPGHPAVRLLAAAPAGTPAPLDRGGLDRLLQVFAGFRYLERPGLGQDLGTTIAARAGNCLELAVAMVSAARQVG
jgi:hypothetical protein